MSLGLRWNDADKGKWQYIENRVWWPILFSFKAAQFMETT